MNECGLSDCTKPIIVWMWISRSYMKIKHSQQYYIIYTSFAHWCVLSWFGRLHLQYIPRNMHTVFALLCFVVVIHWLISPYPSGLLHWHCGNLTIAPVPAKQPWWLWINTSCEFIMNDCITTTKQSTTKPCAYFLGYTVLLFWLFYQARGQWSLIHEHYHYNKIAVVCGVTRSVEKTNTFDHQQTLVH